MDHLEDNRRSLMKACLEEFVVTIYGTNQPLRVSLRHLVMPF